MTLRQTLGFLALCLLSSATWLTSDLLSSSATPILREGFCLLVAGAVGLLIYIPARRSGTCPSLLRCALVSAASLGFIGIPFLLLVAAEGKIASTSVVLVFAGMPILLCVAGAYSSRESGLRLLPGGLMGIAGLLILLPFQAPRGGAALVGFELLFLAMVSTAVCLWWLHGLFLEFPVPAAIGLSGFTNGILLMAVASASAMPHWSVRGIAVEGLRCLLFDLPQVWLLLWLAKTVTPSRFAARYVVAPLFTVLEGLVMLRPSFEVRTVFGLVLLGCSTYFLLHSKGMEPNVSLKMV